MINDLVISQIRQRLEILYQMVDELEEGGGGGGGGTTNYNDLSNKPAIEGQQLVGNKTASDLGLATTSQLNRKVDKVEGSSLMTSAQAIKLEGIEAGAEVNVQADWNQANSSADDYIKNKPTLGTAAERGVDTVPTDNSNNLITSGAVYDSVQSVTNTTYTKTETDTLLAGKADLVDGKVPASQLPSYVDDVAEYASTSAFPATGESGKIYIATDTNKTYRWGGSAYVEISESLALGETASTAYPGNKGKANADAIAAIKDGTTIDSFADVEAAIGDINTVLEEVL